MDPQGFDPPTKTVAEVAEFMERIEMSEDFDGNKKVAAAMKKGNNDKRQFFTGNLTKQRTKHSEQHLNKETFLL